MSKYTTEVRYICEVNAGLTESKGYDDVENIIRKSREKIFDFNYPIFDNEYRSVLETKILRHFYTREIGFETVGLWKLKLNMKMNEIMPYYNRLYNSGFTEVNLFNDVDLKTERDIDRKGNDEANSETNTNNDSWNYYSDTPQGTVGNIKNLTYLTSASNNTLDGNTTGEAKSNFENTEDYLEHKYGKSGGKSFGELMLKLQEEIIDLDLMVISELEELFMYLW